MKGEGTRTKINEIQKETRESEDGILKRSVVESNHTSRNGKRKCEVIEIFQRRIPWPELAVRKSDDPLLQFDANKMTLLTRESSMKRKEGASACQVRRTKDGRAMDLRSFLSLSLSFFYGIRSSATLIIYDTPVAYGRVALFLFLFPVHTRVVSFRVFSKYWLLGANGLRYLTDSNANWISFRARWGGSIDGVATRTRARRASFLEGIKFDFDSLLDFSLPLADFASSRQSLRREIYSRIAAQDTR